MKIGVSLPRDLVAFANEAARRRGTSRSELFAQLLKEERVRQQTREYLDRHGWDVGDAKADRGDISAVEWGRSMVTTSGDALPRSGKVWWSG